MAMNKRQVAWVVTALMVIVASGVVGYRYLMRGHIGTRTAIGISVKRNVRAVCDVSSAAEKGGVSIGLRHLSNLVDAYDRLGVGASERHIHGVFHGDAGAFLLDDEAFEARHPGQKHNPNAKLVENLVDRGVHVEIGADTLKAHGLSNDDVLPEVDIVVGAEPRIVDLELSGYAYLRL